MKFEFGYILGYVHVFNTCLCSGAIAHTTYSTIIHTGKSSYTYTYTYTYICIQMWVFLQNVVLKASLPGGRAAGGCLRMLPCAHNANLGLRVVLRAQDSRVSPN